ncbi:MAG TPA: PPE domain-containing protein [Mycobacterium sp.]|nr:PPE domain-containing protein [Mycobacterium sp.]
MDFMMLPPEVNSGRMYAGPGSGPMMAAAAAWDELAGELESAASSYRSVISSLTSGSWAGPASASMAAAAAPYAAWTSATAIQAGQAATQAKAAAMAYEAAFAATVPPEVVAANRSLLLSLIATNFLGQNTAAIAATEAHYSAMWAQDVTAMSGYAAASASASTVTPFTAPPQTTNAGGLAAQSTAAAQATGTSAGTGAQTLSQLISAVPSTLQSLASPTSSASAATPLSGLAGNLSNIASVLGTLGGANSPLGIWDIGGVPYLLGIQSVLLPQNGQGVATLLSGGAAKTMLPASLLPAAGAEVGSGTGALGAAGLSGAGSTVSAGIGRAGLVGGLSVPQGWSVAAPAIRTVAAVPSAALSAAPMVAADSSGGLAGNVALSSLAGRAVAGAGASRAMASPAARVVGGAVAEEPATSAIFVIRPTAD